MYLLVRVCNILKYLNVTYLSTLHSNTEIYHMQILKFVTFKYLSTLHAIKYIYLSMLHTNPQSC